MDNRLFIIEVSKEANTILTKKSKFNGSHFAKYCLASIDTKTNKMTTEVLTGDILSCIRTALAKCNNEPLKLANFAIDIKRLESTLEHVTEIKPQLFVNVRDIDVRGDGINALNRLNTSDGVIIANVIGQRGSNSIDYGCVYCLSDGNTTMVSWKTLEKLISRGMIMHNIAVSDGKLVRTNISNLGTVYLKVDIPTKNTEEAPAKKKVPTDRNAEATKTKLLGNLLKARSPLAYSLTNDYDLDALQYIIKIRTQGEPIDYMLNPGYNVEQLRALHRAYNKGIDVTIMADPKISARTMDGITQKFEYNLWECIDVQNLHK